MKVVFVLLIVLSVNSCGDEQSEVPQNFPTQKQVNRSLEEINRKFMLDEAIMIDGYVERRGWDMQTTGTGLRYSISELGTGERAQTGQIATVDYNIGLLNGDQVYNSDSDGPKSFIIGHDHVETGLHEGVLLMRVGDKAKFILPSHLAHGLNGDNDKIPPRSSVVYAIELLSLK